MSTQLKAFDTSTVGWLGWCLKYCDDGFGLRALYQTAWDAWMQTDFPHNDRNIPQDVAVPLWFDYWESGIRYGHVVVSVPGEGLYSSPWDRPTGHNVLSSIAEVERIYGVKYVGWSEDISEVRIAITEDNNMQAEIDALNDQLNQTNIYLEAAATQEEVTELTKQLNSTNTYLDKLGVRVAKLEQGSAPLPNDGVYQLTKVTK